MVKNLNAQFTGGFTASELETTGAEDVTGPGTAPPVAPPVGNAGEVVATTGPLPAGFCYVSATAMVHVAAGDGDAFDAGSSRSGSRPTCDRWARVARA